MDKESILGVIREVLKVGRHKLVIRRNGWVNLPCPLAPWRHQKGTDNSPSFGIKINDSDVSVCNCYTCGYSRPVSDLIRDFANYTNQNFDVEIELAEKEEFLGGNLPEWGEEPEDVDERYDPEDALEEEEWDLYDSAKGHPYLQEREIDDDTVEDMHLMVDEEDSEGDERILFPVSDREGNVYGMSGRDVNGDARIRVRDYQGLNKRLFLLGLNLIAEDAEYILVVEGLFDVARFVQYGLPVLGVMGSTLTDAQAEWLLEIGLPVYTFYDNDDAGDKAVEVTIEKLRGHLPVLTVQYPERNVWNEGKGEWELVGDPDQLLYDEVLEMIEEADIAC